MSSSFIESSTYVRRATTTELLFWFCLFTFRSHVAFSRNFWLFTKNNCQIANWRKNFQQHSLWKLLLSKKSSICSVVAEQLSVTSIMDTTESKSATGDTDVMMASATSDSGLGSSESSINKLEPRERRESTSSNPSTDVMMMPPSPVSREQVKFCQKSKVRIFTVFENNSSNWLGFALFSLWLLQFNEFLKWLFEFENNSSNWLGFALFR